MTASCVVVGVLARIERQSTRAVRAALASLPGVTVFEVPEVAAAAEEGSALDPSSEVPGGRIGVLIEAADVDAAHAVLREQVDRVPGVLGTWPVAVESDEGFGPVEQPVGSDRGSLRGESQ